MMLTKNNKVTIIEMCCLDKYQNNVRILLNNDNKILKKDKYDERYFNFRLIVVCDSANPGKSRSVKTCVSTKGALLFCWL